MTVRNKKRLLALAAIFFFLGGMGILSLPYMELLDGRVEIQAPRHRPNLDEEKAGPSKSPARRVSAQDLQVYWQRPLRRVLFDPPPPPPKVVEKPPPRPVTTKLLATMIEPGNTMAMLQLSTGEVVFRKIGDELGASDADVKITSIEEGTIKVIRQNDESKLSVAGQGRN